MVFLAWFLIVLVAATLVLGLIFDMWGPFMVALLLVAALLVAFMPVIAFPMLGGLTLAGWQVAAILIGLSFLVYPEDTKEIMSDVATVIGATVGAVVGNLVSGVASGSGIGIFLLIAGGLWLFAKSKSDDKKPVIVTPSPTSSTERRLTRVPQSVPSVTWD
jgi:hypothetical protein